MKKAEIWGERVPLRWNRKRIHLPLLTISFRSKTLHCIVAAAPKPPGIRAWGVQFRGCTVILLSKLLLRSAPHVTTCRGTNRRIFLVSCADQYFKGIQSSFAHPYISNRHRSPDVIMSLSMRDILLASYSDLLFSMILIYTCQYLAENGTISRNLK